MTQIVIWIQEYDVSWIEAIITEEKFEDFCDYFFEKSKEYFKKYNANIKDIKKQWVENQKYGSVSYLIDSGTSELWYNAFNYCYKEVNVFS